MKWSRRQYLTGLAAGASSVAAANTFDPLSFYYWQQSQSGQQHELGLIKGTYDYIVIGSGGGGGVMACNLVEAGFEVLLLEAGAIDSVPGHLQAPLAHHQLARSSSHRWDFYVQLFDDLSKHGHNYNNAE